MATRAEKLYELKDLQAFVMRTGMYDKNQAARLWITMTASLPRSNASTFIAATADGTKLSLAQYKRWFAQSDNLHARRKKDAEERRDWKLGLPLLVHFEEYARLLATSEISEYGDVSKSLMRSWLNSLT